MIFIIIPLIRLCLRNIGTNNNIPYRICILAIKINGIRKTDNIANISWTDRTIIATIYPNFRIIISRVIW